VIEFEVVGTFIPYRLVWKSSNEDPAKHITVAFGEAAFLGVPGPAPPAPAAGAGGILAGRVLSAFDGRPLVRGSPAADGGAVADAYTLPSRPRLFVVLRGVDATPPALVAEVPIENGAFALTLAPGAYTCVALVPGFMAFYSPLCLVLAGRTAAVNLLFAPIPLPGQARVVLTYGSDPRAATEPRDLDVALLTPAGCEASYKTLTCAAPGGAAARVDRDSRTGQGQEEVTVGGFAPGKYVLRVDERGGAAGRTRFMDAQAVAAYYSPATGGVRYAPGING
jgi:hypothetical protein